MKKSYKMKEYLNDLLNDVGKKFFNIKRSGVKDGMVWSQETEQYLVKEVLKEGVKRYFLTIIQKKLQKSHKSDSTMAGLHATPHSWKQRYPKHELNTLDSNVISKLNVQGYAH